jgi:multiple sugar transport system substrate-binding protein
MGEGRLTRRDLLVAGAGAYAALVTGCGGNPREEITAASFAGGRTYDGPPLTLDFWNGFTGGDGPQMLAITDAFTKEHPNVRIRMVTARWEDFYTKFPAAISSGKGPDVAVNHTDQLPINAAHGAILPLDDLVADLGLREDDFAPDVWKAGIYQGRRYGVPLDMHPLGLFSNAKVLADAGLDPDDPPQDRESYEAALEELKAKGIQGSWASPFLFTGGLQFQSLLWQFGGEMVNDDGTRATWNEEPGVEALTWIKSLIDRGYSPPNIGQDADNIAFKNGEAAFIWNGAWGIGDYGSTEGFEWTVKPLPQIGTQKAAWSGSHNLVVARRSTADSENRLQAAKVFIDFVTRSPAWAEAGQVPARTSARESDAFKKLEAQSALAEQVPYVRFPPAVPGLADVRESTLDQAIAQALGGGATVKEALDDSAARANELLAFNHEKFAS